MPSYLAYNKKGSKINAKPRSLNWILKRQDGKGDVYTIKRSKPPKRDWKVLVKRKNGKGWRESSAIVAGRPRNRFTKREARRLEAKWLRRDRQVKIQQQQTERQIEDALINKWLSGDLDFDRRLQIALARTAQSIRTKLHVNYGRRTRAEQQALYNKYGPGRAARPGTSRHETGLAADVVHARYRWKNVGDIRGWRTYAKRNGISLPVSGEPWHVEMGTTWRA